MEKSNKFYRRKAAAGGVLIAILLLSVSMFLAACGGVTTPTALAAPRGIIVSSDGVMTWSTVVGASSYEVTVNGKKSNTGYTLHELYNKSNRTADGKYAVSIVAVPSNTEKYSKSSAATLDYTVVATQFVSPVIRGFEYNVLSFSAVADADSYVVSYKKLTDTEYTSQEITDTTYSIAKLSDGEYNFKIEVKGDGVYYLNSNVVEVEIVKGSDSILRLPTPKNIKVEDSILTWDGDENASGYFLTDMYGNVSVSLTNQYDLTQQHLIYTVQAMSGNKVIANSNKSQMVEYLRGAGSVDDPYLLNTTFDFRAVNYYEQKYTGADGSYEKRHYRLEKDIEFQNLTEDQKMNFYMIDILRGEFDGNGKVVSKIAVLYDAGEYALFGEILSGGVVKNFTVKDSSISTIRRIDGDGNYKPNGSKSSLICITNRGSIEKVDIINVKISSMGICSAVALFNYGSVSEIEILGVTVATINPPKGPIPMQEAAGIVVNNFGIMDACSVGVGTKISGFRTIGGLCSINAGEVKNCTVATGSITAEATENSEVGSLIGYNGGTYTNCKYTASTKLPECGGSKS